MSDDAPLILTLELDEVTFAFFDEARRRHFPPERNLIPAHLTLFHKLPAADESEVLGALGMVAAATAPFRFRVSGLRFLGYGVAYEIDAPPLLALRSELAERFLAQLTPQDRQPFRPHVTVQNKANASDAKALYEGLRAVHEPFAGTATGLLLWRYRGGPWDATGRFVFSRDA